ncbi:hypothetical protein E2562_031847 [Oryza meyeriana var. granulata]|uniref:Integrase catalytic domain-containing protein n=1 Tax=Oryza meyeriana var. granulata TaxID=110450 RepID=A0A6G1BZX9_9ORYZ|nr:hypothetical protein E2562_031847 [Oryza meyeriana var. granulata]
MGYGRHMDGSTDDKLLADEGTGYGYGRRMDGGTDDRSEWRLMSSANEYAEQVCALNIAVLRVENAQRTNMPTGPVITERADGSKSHTPAGDVLHHSGAGSTAPEHRPPPFPLGGRFDPNDDGSIDNTGRVASALQVPSAVWADIAMDFVEALPRVNGKTVILTMVDRFCKYAHFIPLAHPYKVTTVARAFFTDIVRLHGLSASIVSDRDPVFTSTFWGELFRLAGIQLHFSSAFHPQSDGQSESLCGTGAGRQEQGSSWTS